MPVQTRRNRQIVSKAFQKPSDFLMLIGGERRRRGRPRLDNYISNNASTVKRVQGTTTSNTSKKKTEVQEERESDQEEWQTEKAVAVQSFHAKDMDEWAVMKSMEDQGIIAWKNWCKFQDMFSTVDPRKVILYIDGYVLPRENALLQKIDNDAHDSSAKGQPATRKTSSATAIPVSMIETLIRPVMRLWANQNKKEKLEHYDTNPKPSNRAATTSVQPFTAQFYLFIEQAMETVPPTPYKDD
ncbi:hypothetical protein BGX26_000248 [Mortierella sp. AD094]|nr:hypothetical protein BGX26_000248 [Mortierella sp. AD094]